MSAAETQCPACEATIRARMADDPREARRLAARMAQLEKVAELARTSVRGPDPQAAEHATLLLDLALTELDNHADSREPLVVAEVRPDDRPAREAWPSWRDQRGPSVTEDE